MVDVKDFMVGGCDVFASFLDELRRVARSEATVLLQGESGTGKGQAARALHELGPRADRPRVEVSLAALAPNLIEAELFGHEAGAFTGAQEARSGRFRRASGGTLVLDGIECLPDGLQVKLLRALQERAVEPLGGERAIPVDVRVIATSVRNLAGELQAGRFREDLYYRLAVVTLEVPPLRARLDDLPLLIEHLVGKLAGRIGTAPRAVSAAALRRLHEHPWPGNIRELENALERVLVLAPGPRGESGAASDARPIEAHEFDFLAEATDGVAERVAVEVLAHGLTLDEVGAAVIRRAMREHRGNLSAAARSVGLTRRALEYRLTRLNPTPDDETPRDPVGADPPGPSDPTRTISREQ